MSELVYDFNAELNNGENLKLSEYKDKVLLIVNTASKCGFTPQFEGLESLYEKYKDRNFEILAFPCNQFANQEPLSDEKIVEFCSVTYNVTFPVFKKIEVNGDNAHPLYKFLTKKSPGLLGTEAIKWNFTKFLIDKKGDIYKRYAPATTPEKLESDIEKLIAG